jgi:hypothetical protein
VLGLSILSPPSFCQFGLCQIAMTIAFGLDLLLCIPLYSNNKVTPISTQQHSPPHKTVWRRL